MMKSFKTGLHYFSRTEKLLWSASVLMIVVFFVLFDRNHYMALAASLIGVTSLIFNAKGNPLGQLLMIVFQSAIWRDFIQLCLLRRNGHLSRYDNADGAVCFDFLAQASVQGQEI
ncbi:hypothetical protein [Ruminococcus sp.]|uniref:hypothetical protein n=1 Tax=Ruminococcus sp. TaxID=41978 RepID=UPI00386E8203